MMPKIESNGIKISYDDLGRGEPALILMPGWCANRTVFADIAGRLSVRRRTLVLDWRGHGKSGPAIVDFGDDGLVEDALAVVAASGAKEIVPVALAHAGWVAVELRTRLANRIPKIVLLDWIITEAPALFLSALEGMQSKEKWRETIDKTFSSWLQGIDNPHLIRFVREEMGSYGYEMWSRAAREISNSYKKEVSPLRLLSKMAPNIPVLHLYAQPDDPGYLGAQQSFAESNPWFRVAKLKAKSHFPMFEVPDRIVEEIEGFLA
jgi:pimeloyl-ACP methyl ester carboxylesterase